MKIIFSKKYLLDQNENEVQFVKEALIRNFDGVQVAFEYAGSPNILVLSLKENRFERPGYLFKKGVTRKILLDKEIKNLRVGEKHVISVKEVYVLTGATLFLKGDVLPERTPIAQLEEFKCEKKVDWNDYAKSSLVCNKTVFTKYINGEYSSVVFDISRDKEHFSEPEIKRFEIQKKKLERQKNMTLFKYEQLGSCPPKFVISKKVTENKAANQVYNERTFAVKKTYKGLLMAITDGALVIKGATWEGVVFEEIISQKIIKQETLNSEVIHRELSKDYRGRVDNIWGPSSPQKDDYEFVVKKQTTTKTKYLITTISGSYEIEK